MTILNAGRDGLQQGWVGDRNLSGCYTINECNRLAVSKASLRLTWRLLCPATGVAGRTAWHHPLQFSPCGVVNFLSGKGKTVKMMTVVLLVCALTLIGCNNMRRGDE